MHPSQKTQKGKSQNELIASLRSLAIEYENGADALQCMSEVLRKIKEYDRKG